jgi:hypothetical protein
MWALNYGLQFVHEIFDYRILASDWKMVGSLSCQENIMNDTSVSENVSSYEAFKFETSNSVVVKYIR